MTDRRTIALLSLLTLLGLGCPTAGDDDDSATPTPEQSPSLLVEGAWSVPIGGTLQLSVSTIGGEDGAYAWTSSAPEIATVDTTGLVTALAVGEAGITVEGADTGATATHGVVVLAEPVEFEAFVRVDGAGYMALGDHTTMTAETINGSDSGYGWSSSNEDVAFVEQDGTVEARGLGAATITATGLDTGLSGSMPILVAQDVPFLVDWLSSGHSDTTAEAFRHWDADGEIPTVCARCHSTPGYRDWLGADGSPAGTVDAAAPLGTVIGCTACHSEAARNLDAVAFPSGAVAANLGPEARCIGCHQGRESSDSVEQAIADAAPSDDDTVSGDLSFVNIHYYAAGATQYGGLARGGAQYAGQSYDVRFRHVEGMASCVDCHDPHTTQVRVEACATCHEGVQVVQDLRDVRMMSSLSRDYDGDGDLAEGLFGEVAGVREAAMAALSAYTTQRGAAICYGPTTYPYWFNDTDGDGACSAAEAAFDNAYGSWTARSLRAAYNVHASLKDPGAWVHNGKYTIQLLHDAAQDLNSALTAPADLSAMVRDDFGHFDGAGEPARHWDSDGAVPASCSRCHGASEGFGTYVASGQSVEVEEVANGLDCGTCHATFGDVGDPGDAYSLRYEDSVVMPSGYRWEDPGAPSNLCMDCHSGRTSGADVDASLASGSPSFQNIHYLAAASVRLAGLAGGGYEYPSKVYQQGFLNHPGGTGCVDCHDPVATEHSFRVEDDFSYCMACHTTATEPQDIRSVFYSADIDADGDSSEPAVGELETLAEDLLAEMQTLAALCYSASAYPYWFVDTDADGACSAAEATFGNRFLAWDAPLLKASYNYQLFQKEPGAWAHNFRYVAQLLIDSIEDCGGDVAAYVRPTPIP